MLKSETLKAAI